ncbi:MAG: T9SS type A sorting domain-containing protein [Bacteroidales bacterium]|nr:T9SS type A sorting domain-containing protein [Bacteroidales bacterium]
MESISLSNISGQLIKQVDSKESQLDISEIYTGLYFLKISYKELWKTRRKIQ